MLKLMLFDIIIMQWISYALISIVSRKKLDGKATQAILLVYAQNLLRMRAPRLLQKDSVFYTNGSIA